MWQIEIRSSLASRWHCAFISLFVSSFLRLELESKWKCFIFVYRRSGFLNHFIWFWSTRFSTTRNLLTTNHIYTEIVHISTHNKTPNCIQQLDQLELFCLLSLSLKNRPSIIHTRPVPNPSHLNHPLSHHHNKHNNFNWVTFPSGNPKNDENRHRHRAANSPAILGDPPALLSSLCCDEQSATSRENWNCDLCVTKQEQEENLTTSLLLPFGAASWMKFVRFFTSVSCLLIANPQFQL